MDLDLFRPLALELRHLRLVHAVQELGSLTKAGERLNVSQSALSHQLREIEDRLGLQLFLRVGKRLVATEAGQQLSRSARSILAAMVETEEDLQQRSRSKRGTIRLTTECYTCYSWLPALLEEFERSHPEVRVQIVAEATRRAVDALMEGSVDLALTSHEAATEELRSRPLFDDEMVLVCAPDHPLAKRTFVTPQDLARERMILYSPPESSFFYQSFLAGSGVRPREVMQIQLTEAIVAMVEAGMGVSALTRWSVQTSLRRGSLAAVKLGRRGLVRHWQALVRRERVPGYIDDFIDLIAQQANPNNAVRPFARAG